jgi:putative phosphoribosyl transferase
MIFRDRSEAGRILAKELQHYAGGSDVVVLALPRGGIPVAYEIAQALNLPMDVFVVRKLGVPGHSELAMGAIATGGIRVINEDIVEQLRIPDVAIAAVAAQEQRELERREKVFRQGQKPMAVAGKTVILVDDGLATGATMRAAALALKQQNVKSVVVAVPVAAPSTCEEFREEVDEVVCATTPEPFWGVGYWYQEFPQNTDEEVVELLQKIRNKELTHG